MNCCVDGRHSIIISHRDRNAHLGICTWSIRRSADLCGTSDWELLVIENGSQMPPHESGNVRVVANYEPMDHFRKPRLQNVGIEHATGDVLTFLDADAVVGPRFMDNPDTLRHDPTITKLCYRVRILVREQAQCFYNAPAPVAEKWFAEYDRYARAFEAYGHPQANTREGEEGRGTLFGNSHFSIRRDVLGDLRFDEEFLCHGYEDIIFNWWLYEQRKDTYRPVLVSDGDHAVFNIQHFYDGKWLDGQINRQNEKMYADTINGRRQYGRSNHI